MLIIVLVDRCLTITFIMMLVVLSGSPRHIYGESLVILRYKPLLNTIFLVCWEGFQVIGF